MKTYYTGSYQLTLSGMIFHKVSWILSSGSKVTTDSGDRHVDVILYTRHNGCLKTVITVYSLCLISDMSNYASNNVQLVITVNSNDNHNTKWVVVKPV